MPRYKLTAEQLAESFRRYRDGEPLQALALEMGVTYHALWIPLKKEHLGADGIREFRRLRRENFLLTRQCQRLETQRRIASRVIRLLQPNPVRRSIFVPLIQAQSGLSHRDANRVMALCLGAGGGGYGNTAQADRVLLEMMRTYLAEHPNSGFIQLFNVLKQHRPTTRTQALDLYTAYFSSRTERLHLKSTKKIFSRKMPTQGVLNRVWSVDFIQGALPNGSRFWVITGVDDCSQEAVIAKVIQRRSAIAVINEIDRLAELGRRPSAIRTDRGGEFRSKRYRSWASRRGINLMYSRPRTPTDNCYVEHFNKKLRNDVLIRFDYTTLRGAQSAIDEWLLHYNFTRPHKMLGYITPAQYAYLISHTKQNGI